MKFAALLIPLATLAMAATSVTAQTAKPAASSIWRCGNTYTNDPAEARTKSCKLVEGGNVTIVEGTKVNPAATGGGVKVATAPSSAGSRVDGNEQKARDADARAILEEELKKAESRHDALLKEYNNGEPEKLGPEHRNHQKYLERVAELKASIARNENDIAGIKRELARAGGGTVPASK